MDTEMWVVFGLAMALMVGGLGILLSLAIVVFKDAKAHHLNPWGWAALVIFIPNFIGLIIYLIVRNNVEKEYSCSKCKTAVKKDYNLCPSCQAVFEKTCPECKRAVSNELPYCPYCGQKVETNAIAPTATKITVKTNIVKPLAIIGGAFLTLMILGFVTMFAFAAADGAFEDTELGSNVSVMNLEYNTSTTMKASFKYKNDKNHLTVKKEEGDQLTIYTNVALEKGKILLSVVDPLGNTVDSKVYEAVVEEEVITVPVSVTGKYKVMLEVQEAKGSYEIYVEK